MTALRTFWRRLCCRLNLSHDWIAASTEDGNRWMTCSACGKDGPERANFSGFTG